MLEIDQDALCEHCKEDLNRCEGSHCDNAREAYIEEFGLTEDNPTSFGQLTIGDAVYVVRENMLHESVIEKIAKDAEHSELGFTDKGRLKVPNHLNNVHVDECHLFISKKKALDSYEMLMTLVIKTMARTIAKFEEN